MKHGIVCYRPDGYLFDKEAILEYIITKKNEYYRKLKEYEKQKRKEEVIVVL
jgi:nitric oxide synthase-interacting protein